MGKNSVGIHPGYKILWTGGEGDTSNMVPVLFCVVIPFLSSTGFLLLFYCSLEMSLSFFFFFQCVVVYYFCCFYGEDELLDLLAL